MAEHFRYVNPGSSTGSSHPPPPPPPPPPPSNSYGYTLPSYPYGHGTNYSSQYHQRYLVPGQAPQQSHQTTSAVPVPLSSAQASVNTSIESAKKESSWFCDACDLEFDSEKGLKKHRKTHVKCSDCSFEGSPKVVKAHFQASHGKFSGSGFKTVTVSIPGCRVQRFKICVGNRPEDIKRWIAERKKRFPRQTSSEASTQPLTTEGSPPKSTESDQASGIGMLLAGYGSSGSEDEDEPEKAEAHSNVANTSVDGTTGRDNSSPSQSTTNAGTTNSTPSKTHTQNQPPVPTQRRRPCRYFMRNGTCLNGDACRFSHEISQFQAKRGQKRKRDHRTSSDTLLRKLLSNDMHRESTLAMKLLQYLVETDFLQKQHK